MCCDNRLGSTCCCAAACCLPNPRRLVPDPNPTPTPTPTPAPTARCAWSVWSSDEVVCLAALPTRAALGAGVRHSHLTCACCAYDQRLPWPCRRAAAVWLTRGTLVRLTTPAASRGSARSAERSSAGSAESGASEVAPTAIPPAEALAAEFFIPGSSDFTPACTAAVVCPLLPQARLASMYACLCLCSSLCSLQREGPGPGRGGVRAMGAAKAKRAKQNQPCSLVPLQCMHACNRSGFLRTMEGGSGRCRPGVPPCPVGATKLSLSPWWWLSPPIPVMHVSRRKTT